MAASYAVPLTLWRTGRGPFVLLPLLTLPFAFVLLARREGCPHNITLAATGQLLLAYGLLFTLGLAL